MKDPERLLSSTATDFERLVLRAARLEQPSTTQRRRMRRALLLAEFGFLAVGLKAAASVGNHVVLVAVLASALAGPFSSVSRERPEKNVATLEPRAIPSTVLPTASLSEVGRSPVITSAQANELGDKAPTVDRITSLEARPLRRIGAPTKSVDLRAEIQLLDDARFALRSNDSARALSTISRYFSQFPRGSFSQEASVLRIEALSLSGNSKQAATEAKCFLANHPGSPHNEKLKRVLQNDTLR
jgi:hypothetical protein